MLYYKYKFDKSGTMVVSQANLVEISLVAQPAFADAVITEIAASQPEEDEEVVEPQPNDIPEEETMSQETPAVEASADFDHRHTHSDLVSCNWIAKVGTPQFTDPFMLWIRMAVLRTSFVDSVCNMAK